MMLVQSDDSVANAIEKMRGTGYSRLPVCHDDNDEIIGIVHYKDLFSALLDGNEEECVEKHMFEPMFIPESKNVVKLLEEMQAQRMQMAIVIDEYGGTEGLITVEDIVEEIVGEIADETDDDEEMVFELDENSWRVNGRCPVDEAKIYGWPVEEDGDYETIAGWLLDKLDSVPQAGESLEVDGFQFLIEKMRRNRIQSVRISKQI